MSVIRIIIIASVIVCLLSIVISYLIANGIVDAIKKSISVVGEVSRDADLRLWLPKSASLQNSPMNLPVR